MSFLKKLFGLGGGAAIEAEPEAAATLEHKGFTIRATPYAASGQQQLCGVIEKVIEGEMKSVRFVRADRFPSRDEAAEAALNKGKQIIDEQGDKVFD